MRIYWTIKSIPELSGLPREVRKKNYNEALRRLKTHRAFWAGGLVYIAVLLSVSYLLEMLYTGDKSGPWSFLRLIIATIPASLIWTQINIHLLRKYYKPLLSRQAE